jgi:hypothetical protein
LTERASDTTGGSTRGVVDARVLVKENLTKLPPVRLRRGCRELAGSCYVIHFSVR